MSGKLAHKIAMLLSNPFRPDPRVLKEANSLSERGYQVTLICWDRLVEYPAGERLPNGVVIQRIQNARSRYGIGLKQIPALTSFWRRCIRALDELQPDLIHCHDFDTLPVGLYWGRRRVPVIYDAHEYYPDFLRPRLGGVFGKIGLKAIRRFEIACLKYPAAVIAIDEQQAGHYRPYNPQVLLIGHYPGREFVPQPAAIFTRETLHLLYLGRLSADRGILVYLEILRHLQALGLPARLTLAGTFTPASEKEHFLAASSGIESGLELLDWLPYDQVPALLQQADVGLALLQPTPYYVTRLSVKIFEYMAAGLAVLASDFAPARQFFQHTPVGGLVDPSEPDAAVQQLVAWWQQPELPRRLGAAGRQAILERYNWEALIDQLDALYKKLQS